MKKIILTILLLTTGIFAQEATEIKNTPGDFDLKTIETYCYAIYKKGETKVFQMLDISPEDEGSSACSDKSQTVETVGYDEQSAVFADDYNFDGLMDLALFEGNIGGYGAPSYQIYLFSKVKNKFVKDVEFSELSQYQGMFEINKRNKMLYVYSKSGCCFHQTEGYRVVKNKPLKVYENTIDGTSPTGAEDPEITTKKLINGKWRTWDRSSAMRVSFDKGKTGKTISVKLTKNEPIKWLRVGAAKGQILTVTKNSMDADVSIVDFKGDVSSYESHEPVENNDQLTAKLQGTGDYYLEISAETNLTVSLTITIENDNGNSASGASVPAEYLITPTSVGGIKLGMTVGAAKKTLPKGFKLAPAAGDEGISLVGVYEGEKLLFTIGDYGDFQGSEDEMPPINEDQEIQVMLIFDSRFKTAGGVHVGMPIADAEKIYGKLKEITNYPHSGEIGGFTNQPKNIEFSFRTKSDVETTVGIYEKIPNCEITDSSDCLSLKYTPDSYISEMSLMVASPD